MEETPLDLGSQSLLGYLPAMVIKKIIDDNKDLSKNLPYHYFIKTVSLFADISGFTKLSESFAKLGRIGPEFLAFSLNRYMEQLINIISKNGGDIFKFAGDALLVIWPESQNIEDSCKRAVQCALDIQAQLHNVGISNDKKLSIKIGVGFGEVRILFVGGQFDRAEYLIIGEAMRVACLSETKATKGGQTICHESVHNVIKGFYSYEDIPDDDNETKGMKFYLVNSLIQERIQVRADAYLMRTKFNANKVRLKLPLLKSFVPKAISIYLDLEKERWSKEIRMLTIMFLNLKVDLSQTNSDEGIKRIQNIVKTVQRCIYMTKGALNKFLMDDKGSIMLIAWGLPPISEVNDASRAVYTALELIKELPKYKCGAYMGITTGSCFTGVCGTIGGRREYSLLGEVVNLSARHMQQAIEVGKKKNSQYEIILCDKTKNQIQNDIACEWDSEGKLKGFTNTFQFYKPIKEILSVYPQKKEIFLPQLRTHKNNFFLGEVNKEEKSNEVPMSLNKSIFMVSRKIDLDSFKKDLLAAFKYKSKELLLIRGVYGSGKTLFVRKAFYEFLESNKELKTRYLTNRSPENLDFVFISSQNPSSYNVPFNGFNSIFRQIIKSIKTYTNLISDKKSKTHAFGDENIELTCDLLGDILFETNCYSYQRYIEEILDVKFKNHFNVISQNSTFDRIFTIINIPDIDSYFFRRDFKNFYKTIINFFITLLKYYKEILNFPIALIIEDSQHIDFLSVEFIRELSKQEKLDSIALICTLQDPICNVQKDVGLFSKVLEEFRSDKIYVMDNISDYDDVNNLIKTNLSQINLSIKSVRSDLLDILLKKSYKGNPLFILDIVDSMLNNGFAFIDKKNILTPSDRLLHMETEGDYSTFPVPIRIEKFVGHILDSYSNTKEIITLRFAAAIGNLFSVSTLHSLNEFNSLTFEDILSILYSFEEKGILDVLYDLNVHHSVFMFVIPFCREVIYQRMLIEQKNDLHQSIARSLQKNKFSYMSPHQELAWLNKHLKLSEKNLIDYIKEESYDSKETQLNINNLKLCVIKEVSQNINKIDKHMVNQNMIQSVKSGNLYKKSDKNISWEQRYLAVSPNKIFYWYNKAEHESNKVPLAYIELKHLYQVEVLPDLHFGNRRNLFQIHVAQWYKKSLLQGPRKYIFSCDNRENLYSWVISLNFMRVKALHDEFSINFGVISLPLFAVEQEEKKFEKTLKKKFTRINPDENKKKNNPGVSVIYNNIVRKSVVTHATSTLKNSPYSKNSESNIQNAMSMRRISQVSGRISNVEYESDTLLERALKLMTMFDQLWKYSLVSFFSYLQDIIFNIENTGLDDDLLTIPEHVDELRQLPMIDRNDPNVQYILKRKEKYNNLNGSKIQRNSLSVEMNEIREDTNETNRSKESNNNNPSSISPYINYKQTNPANEDNENQSPTNVNDNINNINNINNNINDINNKNTVSASPTHVKNNNSISILKNSSNTLNQLNNNNLISIKNSNNENKNSESNDDINSNNNVINSNNNSNNKLDTNNSNNYENKQIYSKEEVKSNMLDFNQDEEKTEIKDSKDSGIKEEYKSLKEKKVTGTISVGKNLAEFDMDLDEMDDIQRFFDKNNN